MRTSGRTAPLLAIAVFMVLGLAVGPARAAKLRVNLTPVEKVKVGERACFTGRVTSGGRGVKGAVVRLEGSILKSGNKGRFRVCRKMLWPGTHAAFAFKGKRKAYDRFRVGSSGLTAGPDWKRMDIQFTAYPDSPGGGGYCAPGPLGGPVEFGSGRGYCIGWSNSGTEGPFQNKHLFVEWKSGSPTKLDINWKGEICPCLHGWIDGPGARLYYMEKGDLSLYDQQPLVGGSDPTKAGQPGGPWLLKTTMHTGTFGANDGWTIHTIGYYYETRP